MTAIVDDYLAILSKGLASGTIPSIAIPGAGDLLRELSISHRLGIATANLIERNGHGSLVISTLDEFCKARRSCDVCALADHRKIGIGP